MVLSIMRKLVLVFRIIDYFPVANRLLALGILHKVRANRPNRRVLWLKKYYTSELTLEPFAL